MTKFDPFDGIPRDRRRNMPNWLRGHIAVLGERIDAEKSDAADALSRVARDRDAAQFNYEQKSNDFEAAFTQLQAAQVEVRDVRRVVDQQSAEIQRLQDTNERGQETVAEQAGLRIRAERAQESLLEDLQVARAEIERLDAVVLSQSEAEPYDHTVAELDRPGRFEGDYYASLSFNPVTDSKYRWRVSVGIWVEQRYTARGHAEGYEDKDYWAEPNSILHEFPSQSFKTSEKALTYLLKVRTMADRMAIERRLKDVANGQNTVVA